MTYYTDSRPVSAPRRPRPTLGQMVAIWKQRRQLRSMDSHTLSDLGLTRDEARAEASRPAWDVPAHWLR